MRQCDGSVFYRRTAEPGERGGDLFIDETRIQGINEPGQKGLTQRMSLMNTAVSCGWCFFSMKRHGPDIARQKFLGNQFWGAIYGRYKAYHSFPGKIALTECMAHAGLRFDEALIVLKKDFTKKQLKETNACQAGNDTGQNAFVAVNQKVRIRLHFDS